MLRYVTIIAFLFSYLVFPICQAQSPIANYPFNGNAQDETSNGFDGSVNGAKLTTDRFDNANSAFNFDGIDDSIDLGTNPIRCYWNYNHNDCLD